jgi:hypothetical protein
MARVAPAIPEETALLCEKCGYIINGIPTDSLCPECASPIADSLPENRRPPLWEQSDGSASGHFWATTAQIIFQPSKFYRSITSRGDLRSSAKFARWHYAITSLLFGGTAFMHGGWAWGYRLLNASPRDAIRMRFFIGIFLGIPLCLITAYLLIVVTTNIASRLTAWEAAYRGLRLPRPVVQRALHYHSAHYLPVALVAFFTVFGFLVIIKNFPDIERHAVNYLYILCAEVILAAAYLFMTYWTGMRNLMYANG